MLEEWGLNFEEGEKERRERELFIYMHTLRSYIRVGYIIYATQFIKACHHKKKRRKKILILSPILKTF